MHCNLTTSFILQITEYIGCWNLEYLVLYINRVVIIKYIQIGLVFTLRAFETRV